MSYKIYLVEDEENLNDILKSYLEKEGLKVTTFLNGELARENIDNKPDLWVLDIMLPDIDGFQLLKEIKEKDKDIPVIFISARDEDIDRIIGLEMGSDDYIAKPFMPRELVIRVQKLLKRVYNSDKVKDVIIIEGYTVDLEKRLVKLKSEEIPMTSGEFDLLMLLINKNGGNEDLEDKPIVVIAMHGRSTASSMAEVVNKLVKANNVFAYDMTLDISSEVAYEKLKDIIIRKNQGAGVLLLVDMGSLNIYGELINKDTGIDIRTLDMASTPVAIECSRRAVIESNIDMIYEAIKHDIFKYSPYELKVSESFIPKDNNIIITLCTTGEGSAIKLKSFIESKINTRAYKVELFAMAWNNKQHMYNVLGDLSKQKNILAIVGTINPKIYGVPFISTYEVFMDKDCYKIKQILDKTTEPCKTRQDNLGYGTFIESLQSEIHNLDLSKFEELYKEFICIINNKLNMNIEYEVSVSLMVHMICNVSKILAKENIPVCSSKEILKEKFKKEFIYIKEGLLNIEKLYKISFNDDEIAFILQNILRI